MQEEKSLTACVILRNTLCASLTALLSQKCIFSGAASSLHPLLPRPTHYGSDLVPDIPKPPLPLRRWVSASAAQCFTHARDLLARHPCVQQNAWSTEDMDYIWEAFRTATSATDELHASAPSTWVGFKLLAACSAVTILPGRAACLRTQSNAGRERTLSRAEFRALAAEIQARPLTTALWYQGKPYHWPLAVRLADTRLVEAAAALQKSAAWERFHWSYDAFQNPGPSLPGLLSYPRMFSQLSTSALGATDCEEKPHFPLRFPPTCWRTPSCFCCRASPSQACAELLAK